MSKYIELVAIQFLIPGFYKSKNKNRYKAQKGA